MLTLLLMVEVASAADVAVPSVTGTVVTVDGTPVPGAWVFAGDAQGQTDTAGHFNVPVPSGTWDVQASGNGWTPQSVTVTVADSPVEVKFVLAPVDPNDTADVIEVVGKAAQGSATVINQEKHDATTVIDAVGSAQMSRSGDSTAGAALKRVTGLSVEDGKYVIVRGLGDRYASTMLDGTQLPSPEPEQRVVPLDLFPTSFLGEIVVHKSPSAELPGEAGSGAIELVTRELPDRLVTTAGLTGAYRLGTAFTRGPWGSFGTLPASIVDASANAPLHESDMFTTNGYTQAQLEKLGEDLPNRWDLTTHTALPDFAFQGAVGGPVIGSVRALLAVGLRDSWLHNSEYVAFLGSGPDGTLVPDSHYQVDGLTHMQSQSGLLLVGTHSVRSTTLLTREDDDDARLLAGPSFDTNSNIRNGRTQRVVRTLVTEQLRGKHKIGKASELDWRYAYSMAFREQPDQREWVQIPDNSGGWLLHDNDIFDGHLADHTHDAAVDLRIPLDSRVSIQSGIAGTWKDRTLDVHRYSFAAQGPSASDPAVLGLPVGQVFTPANIGSDGFQLEENTLATDNVVASQQVLAAYILTEMQPNAHLTLQAGVRVERSTQNVKTFAPFDPSATPVVATLGTTDLLPSGTLTWHFSDKAQLRAAGGTTVNRPEFRELSPATYTDITGVESHGNAGLTEARITHADLRFEWYPTAADTLSIGVFYKDLHNPIEMTIVPSTIRSVTFTNVGEARDVGVELDGRADVVHGLWLAGNVALMDSQVAVDSVTSRPLQGQSPYVASAVIGYDHPSGFGATVQMDVTGPHIVEVGSLGMPDIIEHPAPTLDVSLLKLLNHGWSVTARGQNLLDPEHKLTQGDVSVQTQKVGRVVSLTATWTR